MQDKNNCICGSCTHSPIVSVSYGHANTPLRRRFGICCRDQVSSMRVSWPSGHVCSIRSRKLHQGTLQSTDAKCSSNHARDSACTRLPSAQTKESSSTSKTGCDSLARCTSLPPRRTFRPAGTQNGHLAPAVAAPFRRPLCRCPIGHSDAEITDDTNRKARESFFLISARCRQVFPIKTQDVVERAGARRNHMAQDYPWPRCSYAGARLRTASTRQEPIAPTV